jgi:hypothetical protein
MGGVLGLVLAHVLAVLACARGSRTFRRRLRVEDGMESFGLVIAPIAVALPLAMAAGAAPASAQAKPATSKVDLTKAAPHERHHRHRKIAAAHEAAAKCRESGRQHLQIDVSLPSLK